LFEHAVRTLEPRGGNTLRRYEILFIAHADLSEDNLNEIIERYKKIINDSKGVIVKIDKWGIRKLAYEIKKQTKGIYVLIDFAGSSAIILELERNFRIDDKILKFLTVLRESDFDPLELEKKAEIPAEAKITPPETDSQVNAAEAATELPVDEKSAEGAKEEKE
jgi:small subunit ribosomal protein S6